MPTLNGFWAESDIALRDRLGLLSTPAAVKHAYRDRAADKQALLARLRDELKLIETAPERFAELGRRRGWDLVVMYGQTEATARMAYLPPERARTRPKVALIGAGVGMAPLRALAEGLSFGNRVDGVTWENIHDEDLRAQLLAVSAQARDKLLSRQGAHPLP